MLIGFAPCRERLIQTFATASGSMMMAATQHDTDSSPRHIGMVVDDDAMIRESVVAVLEDLCDEVYEASDGQEGIEVLHEHPDISLVVTDIAMPRLDGIGFASQARLLHPNLKVLFVSGLQRPPANENFLAKPFMARTLISAVRRLLGVS
jgi:CheY-like chemotaxis protein